MEISQQKRKLGYKTDGYMESCDGVTAASPRGTSFNNKVGKE